MVGRHPTARTRRQGLANVREQRASLSRSGHADTEPTRRAGAVNRPRKALIVSGSPDVLNTNALLRDYVTEGFRRACPDAEVVGNALRARLSVAPFAHTGPRAGIRISDDRRAPTTTVSPTRCAAAAVAWPSGCTMFDTNDRIIPLADVVFTNDAASLDYYPVAVRAHHLPLGGCPVTHFRVVDRRAAPDLFFCGHLFENRRQFLEQLCASRTRALERRLIVIGSSDVDARVLGRFRATVPNTMLPDYYNSRLFRARSRNAGLAVNRHPIGPPRIAFI